MRLYKVRRSNAARFSGWRLTTWPQFFLINSMFLQLSLFFTITAISLWIDQLRNSEIAVLAHHAPLYYALFIFTVVVRTSHHSRYQSA